MTVPYKFDAEIAWLTEAARYFANRPTGGEDRAHWANVYNAENANKLASRLRALASPVRDDGSSADADTQRSAEAWVLGLPDAVLLAASVAATEEMIAPDEDDFRKKWTLDSIARVRADPTGEEAMTGIRPVRLLLQKVVEAAASVSPGMETLQASECTKHGEADQ